MKHKFEFFSLREIIAYIAIFSILGIFIGWSFSKYKIIRIKNIDHRI